MRLRPGTEADAPGISTVHFEAIRGTAAAFYPPEIIDSWSRAPDEARFEQLRRSIAGGEAMFVVADDDGDVLGFGSVVPSSHELRAVYVHPRAGRRGIGARILEQLEQLAIARGVPELHLDASLNAEAFYARHGYQVIERGIHRLANGVEMACVKMRKSLVSST
jgi:putative acetyltransferase